MMRKNIKMEDVRLLHAFALFRGLEFFHFSSTDIDLDNRTILGNFWDVEKQDFIEKTAPYPHVILDHKLNWQTAPSRQKRLALQKAGVVLSWVNLGRKTKVYNILKNSPLSEYAIETHNVKDISLVDVLENQGVLIAKPNISNEGSGIYKLYFQGDGYLMHTKHEIKALTLTELLELEQTFRENEYIIQDFVYSRTNAKNPFDIKIYLVRSGEGGSWVTLPYFPRIGSSLGVVSSTVTGGNGYHFLNKFLEWEFGEDWKSIKSQLDDLVEQLPTVMQKHYNKTLNTLEVSVGIDRKNNNLKLFDISGTVGSCPYKKEMYMARLDTCNFLYENRPH